ncbi:MAG TPA: hypothetical protein PK357_00155 [Candidatus Pacearchaeota archaeon]|nr:hypothetical protein [Candidatus Pacearchaeota archaeon]
MKFEVKRFMLALFFALFIFSLFGSLNLISAAEPSNSGGDTTYNFYNDRIVNTDEGAGKILGFLNLTGTWREILLGFLILLIIFAAMYDILQLISIFQSKWVILLIAFAIALAAALTNFVHKMAVLLTQILAGLGAAAIFVEIAICIVIFVGLSFGSTWIGKWAAKRKGNVEEIKAIKSAGQAKAAIRGMREIQEEFRRKS